MKYIRKQTEPPELTEWKELANEDWQPSYDYLGSKLKTTIKEALMKEQGYICCYCEQRLVLEDSHIEHFQPQSDPSVDPLDFGNMLCSCQSQIKKGEPRHCGNLKGDWFHADLLISPLEPNCETSFKFTADGYIQARNDQNQAAITTIQKLGLDIPKLRELRKQTIEPFLDPFLSTEELDLLVQDYLSPSESGGLSQFCSSIRYIFEG